MASETSPRTKLLIPALLALAAGCVEPDAPSSASGADPESPRASSQAEEAEESPVRPTPDPANQPSARELATLGAGCFWCIEAVLEQIDGVLEVTSGYMGGEVEDPSYKQVCSGTTGHAEVVQVAFDPSVVSYEELLGWFWRLHDPTTLNRQGADVGTQYRSAIFTHSEEQRAAAERSKTAAQGSGAFSDPIVTEITPAGTFYPAEAYHQDYYRQNKSQGYCRVVIAPKLDKLGLED